MSTYIAPRGWSMIAWLIVFNILLVVVLALRYYSARLLHRSIRLDDGLVIGAYISLLTMEGTMIWAILNGFGAHVEELDPGQQIVQLKLILSSAWTWTFATVSCKLALLTFYNIIFTTKRFRLASYTVMGACVAYAIAFIPVFMTRCRPLEASWKPTLGYCRPIKRQEYASISINMVLDLIIVLLPLPTIWTLQMPLRKKIFVSCMFSLGLLTVAIMAWRIWSTVQQERSSDIFYDWYYIGLQSQLEIWLGMIAASLPTLAPIASKLIAPAFSKLIASYRKHGAPLGNRTNESRKTGGGCGDVPLPKLDTNHFDGESIVGFGNVQHWGTAESIRREDDSFTETHSDEQRDGHDAIIVRHGYSVLAEPRQEV